jgi:WD40 repeat protein
MVAISPDGSLLAANMSTADFSPTGRLAADSLGHAIFLWNITDGSLIRQIPANPETYYTDLEFSPEGQVIAAGFGDGTVQLWRAADGQPLFPGKGSLLEFAPDGNRLVTMPSGVDSEEQIYLYSTVDGTLLQQWDGQRAVFSPAGQLAVENGGAVRVMDLENDRVQQAFNGENAAFSADGQLLALFAGGAVKLYQVADGALSQTLEGRFEEVDHLRFAPGGQSLATATMIPMCPDCIVTGGPPAIWRVSDGALIETDLEYSPWLTYNPEGDQLVVASSDRIHFLSPADGAAVDQLDQYSTAVDGVAFSPDGQLLASGSGNPNLTARLWRVADGQLLDQFEDPFNQGHGYSSLAFSPDGRILWAQGSFWNVAGGERLTGLEQKIGESAPPYVISSLAFTPDGETMALGYLEGKLLLWDLAADSLLTELQGLSGAVESLAFSPDGKTLAAVYTYPDYIVQLWQVPQGERLLAIAGEEWTHVFTQVVFSPDGQTLATVAKNEDRMDLGVVELWRAADGERLFQLDAEGIMCAAFSPDGLTLATGSYDRTVRLWQATDGARLGTLPGHSDYITDLSFSPNGELLASGSNDGTVILWGLPPPE